MSEHQSEARRLAEELGVCELYRITSGDNGMVILCLAPDVESLTTDWCEHGHEWEQAAGNLRAIAAIRDAAVAQVQRERNEARAALKGYRSVAIDLAHIAKEVLARELKRTPAKRLAEACAKLAALEAADGK